MYSEAESIIDSLKNGHLVKNVSSQMNILFRPSVQPYMISWFRHDPAEYVKKLKSPLLIIQAEKDIQVDMEEATILRNASPKSQFYVVKDIFNELEKPGRDPRPEFKTANFQEGIESISDLIPGLVLEGVVSNVAAFGAFVDIGVGQDGLVHISALSDQFVKDPREVVRVGQTVKVKVMDVEVERNRINLSMRLDDEPGVGNNHRSARSDSKGSSTNKGNPRGSHQGGQRQRRREAEPMGAMAAAFAKLKK